MATAAELDALFDLVDDLLINECFDEVDARMDALDVATIDSELLLAWATATFAYRDELQKRAGLMERIGTRLEADLLAGLY
jgi:hypothetical protein